MNQILRDRLVEYCENFNPKFCRSIPLLSWQRLHDTYQKFFNIESIDSGAEDLSRSISVGVNSKRLKMMYEEIWKRPWNGRDGGRLSEDKNLSDFSDFVLNSKKRLFVFVDYPNMRSLSDSSLRAPKRLCSGFHKDIERVTNLRELQTRGTADLLSLVYAPIPLLLTQARIELLRDNPNFYSEDANHASNFLVPLFRNAEKWRDLEYIKSVMKRFTFLGSSYSGCYLIEVFNSLRDKIPIMLHEGLESSCAIFLNVPWSNKNKHGIPSIINLHSLNDLKDRVLKGLYEPKSHSNLFVINDAVIDEGINVHSHLHLLNQRKCKQVLCDIIENAPIREEERTAFTIKPGRFVLHYGSEYTGLGHAIGGYLRSLERACHEVGITSRIIDTTFDEDPRHMVITKIKALGSEGYEPILHLQLTLPGDKCPFSPDDFTKRDYGLVITCQEFERRKDTNVRDRILSFLDVADRIIFLGEKDYRAVKEHSHKSMQTMLEEKSSLISIVPPSFFPTQLNPPDRRKDICSLNLVWPGRTEAIEICVKELYKRGILTNERKFHIIGRIIDESIAKRLDNSFGRLYPLVQMHYNKPDYYVSALLNNCLFGVSSPRGGITDYGTVLPTFMAHGVIPIVSLGYKSDLEYIQFPNESIKSGASLIGSRLVDYTLSDWHIKAGESLADAVCWACKNNVDYVRAASNPYLSERTYKKLGESHKRVYERVPKK